MTLLKAPFPWFGGKSRAAQLIWERLGNVPNYCEPFAGSLAVLLGRPHAPGTETVNDKDGFVCNAWRALVADPEAVARYADWPCMENDLHARHVWLKTQRDSLTARLEGDPNYYDAKIAGWWLWGIAQWIGRGWCGDSGGGPWQVVDGQLLHLGDAGQGVSRQLLHLGDAGQGVNRDKETNALLSWFQALQDRLRRVRVCCGDWQRVMGSSVLETHGVTGVVLDPPYLVTERDSDLYAIDDGVIAHTVREWALAHGDNPLLRIALCGYATPAYAMPPMWAAVPWKANGGYGNQVNGRGRANATREIIWFSPHCLTARQPNLWGTTSHQEGT